MVEPPPGVKLVPWNPSAEAKQAMQDTTDGKPMKGYISTEKTVWCGLCDNWMQESISTTSRMAKRARSRGWKYTRAHGWVCPNEHK